MPQDGLEWLPTKDKLTDDEVIRLVTIAVDRLGITEVRFTGGEPLLRKGLERVIAATAELRTVEGAQPDISLTTNALGLDKRARKLAAAGLRRVNISLDSGDSARYLQITHRDRFADVVRGIEAAVAAGLGPIKVNAVAMRSVNDTSLPDLLDFCLDRGLELRIIEHMPLGPSARASESLAMPLDEILAVLSTRRTLHLLGRDDPAAPAKLWRVEPVGDRPGGRVGVIASMSDSFCSTCDRTRLTADGQIRSCLFSDHGADLRYLLRGHAGDHEIAQKWADTMRGKPRQHGSDDDAPVRPDRYMNAIGG